jgi:hypothetical protein
MYCNFRGIIYVPSNISYNYASKKLISIIQLKMLSNFYKIKDLNFLKIRRKSIIFYLDLKSYNSAKDGYSIQNSINAKKKNIQYNNNNGPDLKDFIRKSNMKNNYSSNEEINDEIVSNKIFLKHINNLNLNDHEIDELADSFYKRKVFFEVHGCQMNVNDTGN